MSYYFIYMLCLLLHMIGTNCKREKFSPFFIIKIRTCFENTQGSILFVKIQRDFGGGGRSLPPP